MGYGSSHSNLPRTGWCRTRGQRAGQYRRITPEDCSSSYPLELLNHRIWFKVGVNWRDYWNIILHSVHIVFYSANFDKCGPRGSVGPAWPFSLCSSSIWKDTVLTCESFLSLPSLVHIRTLQKTVVALVFLLLLSYRSTANSSWSTFVHSNRPTPSGCWYARYKRAVGPGLQHSLTSVSLQLTLHSLLHSQHFTMFR